MCGGGGGLGNLLGAVVDAPKGFNAVRNDLESAAAIAGNYFLPGSSLVTDNLVSKGSQQQLSSPIGEIANIGSGLAGSGVLGQGLQSAGGALESNALNSALGTASNALGFSGITGGGAAGAAPGISSAPGVIDAGGSSALLNPVAAGGGAGGALGGAASAAAPAGASVSGGLGGDVTSGISGATSADQAFLSNAGVSPSTISGGSAFNQALAGNAALPANAATGAGGAATPATNSFSQFIQNPTLGNAGNILSSNSNLALPAAGLAYNALAGSRPVAGENALSSEAAALNNQGASLQSYLQSGTLPAGLQSGLNQAQQAAEATIRSQYAARGMSGSSAEAQDLANVQQQIAAQGANYAMNLLQQGVSETGLASQLYTSIMNGALQSDQQLGQAISAFGTAAAGGSPGLKLQIGGTNSSGVNVL